MAAPETVFWGLPGATLVLRVVPDVAALVFEGAALGGGVLADVAASASATVIAPILAETARLRAVRDFLIRDLHYFWSH
jgi:hypothetical protein